MPFAHLVKPGMYEAWRGLAFEECCRRSHHLIARILGFSGIAYEFGSWFKKADQATGAQIDLLFKRADRTITMCEVKYTQQLDNSIGSEFEHKEARLRRELDPDGFQRVLITAYDPEPGTELTRHIDRVISLQELLGVE